MTDTTVYEIGFDVERFQALLVDLPEEQTSVETWTFDGTPKAGSWTPLPVYSDRPRLERPDVWHLVGAAVLAMDAETIGSLEPFVRRAGELLELTRSDTRDLLYALNILEDIDCLDPTAWDLDKLFLCPRFLEHRLPETGLFKIPQSDTVDIFSVERTDDDDSFRRRIDRLGLKGLTFRLVWSASAGPAYENLIDPRLDL
jgi:hypothetical protein